MRSGSAPRSSSRRGPRRSAPMSTSRAAAVPSSSLGPTRAISCWISSTGIRGFYARLRLVQLLGDQRLAGLPPGGERVVICVREVLEIAGQVLAFPVDRFDVMALELVGAVVEQVQIAPVVVEALGFVLVLDLLLGGILGPGRRQRRLDRVLLGIQEVSPCLWPRRALRLAAHCVLSAWLRHRRVVLVFQVGIRRVQEIGRASC